MNRKFFFEIDWALIAPIMILVALSLTTLFSISFSLFRSQLIFFIVGFLAFLFFSKTNYSIVKLYSVQIYVISIISLLLVLGIGIESRGSLRWFEIFGFRFQFSEILKPFLAISLCSYLATKNNHSLRALSWVFLLLSPIIFLIFMQPDLGNALIYLIVTSFTLVVFGFPVRFFIGMLFLVILSLPVLFRSLHSYQTERIFTFLHPTDYLGSSYNVIQSIIAVGSGMLFGRGLGLGTQSGLRFLPERHTDFIFATTSEALGFVGSSIVVLAFALLLYRIFLITSSQEDLFYKLFATAVFFLIFTQFFVNIGMNIGIVPIVGITLPFVSYGGSSLLSNFILIGLLSGIGKKTVPGGALEIK
ncbi:MAG: FtsW/RodA/SpoVE family cell cycle protein [Patescibacteria group bacterium]